MEFADFVFREVFGHQVGFADEVFVVAVGDFSFFFCGLELLDDFVQREWRGVHGLFDGFFLPPAPKEQLSSDDCEQAGYAGLRENKHAHPAFKADILIELKDK